jgi:hypothetical protein
MLELINEKRSEYMMAASLYLDEGDGYTEDVLLPYPSEAPIPAPPALSKFEVYNDPVEFADIDQIAISVRKQLNRADKLSNLWPAKCYWHEKRTGLNDIPGVESGVQRYDILTELNIQITVLWHVLPCRLVDRHWTALCNIIIILK